MPVNGHASADSPCTPRPVETKQGGSTSTYEVTEAPISRETVPGLLTQYITVVPATSAKKLEPLQADHTKQLRNGCERSSYTTLPPPTVHGRAGPVIGASTSTSTYTWGVGYSATVRTPTYPPYYIGVVQSLCYPRRRETVCLQTAALELSY
jgi:hypothetical protein